MINEISIECVKCHQVSDLFLSTKARVVIFRCPSCGTPVMYFNGKSYLLSETQTAGIMNSRDENEISSVIRRIVDMPDEAVMEGFPGKDERNCRNVPLLRQDMNGAGEHDVITRDDILNLLIDLQTSRDSGEFLARL